MVTSSQNDADEVAVDEAGDIARLTFFSDAAVAGRARASRRIPEFLSRSGALPWTFHRV